MLHVRILDCKSFGSNTACASWVPFAHGIILVFAFSNPLFSGLAREKWPLCTPNRFVSHPKFCTHAFHVVLVSAAHQFQAVCRNAYRKDKYLFVHQILSSVLCSSSANGDVLGCGGFAVQYSTPPGSHLLTVSNTSCLRRLLCSRCLHTAGGMSKQPKP